MTDEHTEDLRNVWEADWVTITTTEGKTFEATCTDRSVQHAHPQTGEVRETTIWTFEAEDTEVAASILDGLKSSADDPDFPQHSELWRMEEGEAIGYIETVEIHGPEPSSA